MLAYNGESLSLQAAERAQGFFVSEDHMEELLRNNFETFGVNDFVYNDGESDKYEWVNELYSQEKYENDIENKSIDIMGTLDIIILNVNKFFKGQRDALLDKESLANDKKNIEVDYPRYSTKEELENIISDLDFSNSFIRITSSFIDVKLNISYLSSMSKLKKLEDDDIIDLKLDGLTNTLKYTPLAELSREMKEALRKEGKENPLVANYMIVQEKANCYLRCNFTKYYKAAVVFPNSPTILQRLNEKFGNKLESLNRGKVYILNKGEID